MNAYNHIVGFEISMEEITDVVKKGRLLSMEMEFSLHCNFRCPYCYVPQKPSVKDELSVETIQDLILQAKGMGAKRIIILGGEPSIYPHILEMIRFIRENGLEVEMFTNGSGVTLEFAEILISENVRVVLKFNTFDSELQDKLAGKKEASKIINDALANLLRVGYPSEDAFLAFSTIICRQNLDELPEMWKWLRDRNIVPYFEMITPQGDAKQNKWLEVSALEVKDLFTRLAAIDSEKYGLKWEPQPPLVGNRCMRHQFSCMVNSKGDVMPCVGVTIPVGNIHEKKLADIIRDSEVFRNLKNFRHTIKGKCHSCKKADTCYGCRGAAYQLTGDYLASDPLCWENITP